MTNLCLNLWLDLTLLIYENDLNQSQSHRHMHKLMGHSLSLSHIRWVQFKWIENCKACRMRSPCTQCAYFRCGALYRYPNHRHVPLPYPKHVPTRRSRTAPVPKAHIPNTIAVLHPYRTRTKSTYLHTVPVPKSTHLRTVPVPKSTYLYTVPVPQSTVCRYVLWGTGTYRHTVPVPKSTHLRTVPVPKSTYLYTVPVPQSTYRHTVPVPQSTYRHTVPVPKGTYHRTVPYLTPPDMYTVPPRDAQIENLDFITLKN